MKKIYTLFILLIFISINLNAQSRYWVNGSGNWNDVNHWAETSGGESGFSVPIIYNDVYFDENSTDKEILNINLNQLGITKSLNASIKLSFIGEKQLITYKINNKTKFSFNKNIKLRILNDPETRGAGDSYTVSCSSTNETCPGDCDGSITVDYQSGTIDFPITILLNGDENDGSCSIDEAIIGVNSLPYTFNNICGCGTDYNIAILDNDNDVAGCDANVSAKAPMSPFKTITNETCPSDCDGKIKINVVTPFSGAPYSYNWSNSETTNTISNLCAAKYFVTITDKDGCTEIFDYDVTAPPAIIIDDSTYSQYICDGGTGFIDVDASGGTGTLTYDIGGGTPTNNDGNFTGLSSGTYTIIITDDNNCSITSGPYKLENNTVINISDTHSNPLCNGDTNGSINITVTGGTSPYTYSWATSDGNGLVATDKDQTNLTAGTYDLNLTDAVGCTKTYSVTLTENGILTLTEENIQNISCNTLQDGAISISLSGGTGAGTYNYNWATSDGSGLVVTDKDQTNLSAGTYNLTVTDGNGCTVDSTWTLTEPAAVVITENNIQNLTCKGSDDGIINISVSGGDGSFNYSWATSNGSGLVNGQEDQSGLGAGTYNLTVTDGKACSVDSTWTLTEPAAVVITEDNVQNLTCNGSDDGIINISVSGGDGSFSYNWATSNGSGLVNGQEDQSGLGAGTYNLTVTDGKACTATQSWTLTEPAAVVITENNVQNLTCNGSDDGIINISVSGGDGSFSYNWATSNGSGLVNGQEDQSGLGAGTYNLTVTDGKGCSVDSTWTLTEPAAVVITEDNVQNITCNGSDDGIINISVSGGDGSFNYNWATSNGSGLVNGQEDQSGLGAGTYNLTVTDGKTCTATQSWTLTEPTVLSLSETHNNPSCNQSNNGSIDLTVNGGTIPYTFNWTTTDGSGLVNNQQNQSNLTAGTYDVTVTDANSCTQSLSILLNDPNAIILTETHTDVSCNGYNNGAINLNTSGGSPAYMWNWEDAANPGVSIGTSEDVSGLTVGTYCVTVTDQGPCTDTLCVTITEPAGMTITTDSTIHVNCNGGNDGGIYINISGGTSPYTYTWQASNGGSGIVAGQEYQATLTAGIYNLTVTDFNGCEKYETWIITEPLPLNITETHIDPSCNTGTNGSIDITANGGTAGYTYNWATADGSGLVAGQEDQSNLTGGTYDVTVTDANSCTQTLNIILNDPNAILISELVTNVDCYGANTGAIDLSTNGGTTPYSWNWEDQANPGVSIGTDEDINGLSAATYCVYVVDGGPCPASKCITISQPTEIIIATDSTVNVKCNGGNDGGIYISISGGTGVGTYNFTWQTLDGSGIVAGAEDQTTLTAGTYNLTVADGSGCEKYETWTITEPLPIVIATDSTSNPNCNSGNNGNIYIAITDGVAPYTFNWQASNGGGGIVAGQEDQTTLTAGTYNLTVTDANNCTQTETWTITEPSAITITLDGIVDVFCNGGNDGKINISVAGGTVAGDYTYNWEDNANPGTSISTNEDLSGVSAGTYNITVTDDNNCTAIGSWTINEPAPITFTTENSTNITCFGDNDGTIDVVATNGSTPYSYNLGTGAQANGNFTNLTAGTYNVTVTDNNNCTAISGAYIIIEPDSLQTNFYNIVQNVCDASCNGQATLSVNGGTIAGGYTYNWNPVPTTITNDTSLADLCPNKYNVTVTDDNNCTDTSSVTIIEIIPISITEENLVNLSCNNVCTGEVEIEVTANNPPYTISWDNGDNDTLSQNLCAGNHTVTVTDVNHCVKDTTFTISEPDMLQYTLELTHNKCFGYSHGQVTVHTTGGTAPYSFDFGTGNTTDSVNSGLASGGYSVIITDANNCSTVANYIILQPTQLTNIISINSQPSCAGICDADAITSPSGGAGSYNYVWTSNETNANATALCDGWNFVTITDDSLCTLIDSIQIIEPSVITVTYDTTNVKCNGECTGEITANVAGGTLPYNFIWQNGDNNSTISNLCANDYSVTVTDANLCQFIDTIEIIEPTPITVGFNNINNISCYGICDGSATAIANGGAGNYTYAWGNTENTATASALCAGLTNVTITDDSLCTIISSVNLTQPDSIKYTIETINPLCNGDCNGSVIIHVIGGTAPISFNWGSGATPNDSILVNKCAGDYFVTITDGNGCSAPVATATITDYPVITANITDSTMLSCYNECNGTATVAASGGTGNYIYSWSNADNTTIADSLCAQEYVVTVSDDNFCTAVDTVIITQPDSIEITFTNITQVDCGGNCTGEATISVIGGTPAYTYAWPNGQSVPTIDTLCANLYEVTVTDANLCSNIATIEIIDTSDLVLSTTIINHITCNGLCDGSAFATSSGGYPPYNYTWNTAPITNNDTVTGLCANTYQVTVLDDSLCSRVAQVTIDESEMLVANEHSTNPTCNGNCDGEVWVNITGGLIPYSLNWETSSTDTIISNLCEDWYTYTIIDANNCQINDSIQIIAPNVVTIDITDSLNVKCFGDSTGYAVVTVVGGTNPYTYTWSNGATNATANNLWAGTHFITVEDANGCSAIDSLSLTQGDSLYVDFINITNPHCGECNGEITAVAGGGMAGYLYQWGASAMNSTDSNITNLCVNMYDITVTDANSCNISSSYILNDTSSLAVNVVDSTMATCSYSCNGAAAVEGTNGVAPYSYTWSTGDLDSTIENQCVGYYYITVQDAQNCTNIDSVEITGPDELIISLDSVIQLSCSGDCNGEIAISAIGGTPAYSFLWSTNNTDTIISNLCQGHYSVTVSDIHNCVDSLDTLITAPIPIVLTFTDSIPLCNNGTADGAIYLDAQGGVPGYTFLWSNNDTTQNIINIDGGWYSVSVTDTLGCQISDSTFLAAAISVTAQADSNTIICSKDSVQLYGSAIISDGTGYNYVWHPGVNMVDSNAQNPIVFVDTTTVFYFYVYHNNGICFDVDSVTVSTYPIMTINAGEDVTILHDQSTTLVSTGGDDSTLYQWLPDEYLETPFEYSTVTTPEETTMYYIIATSQYGCISTDSVKVTVIPELIVPNGITPNGDGINDVWKLDYVYLFPDIEVEVFNRWGEQMFYSKGYPDSERWDGNYKGKPLPTGTYYYIIKLNDGIHKDPFTGPITIVR